MLSGSSCPRAASFVNGWRDPSRPLNFPAGGGARASSNLAPSFQSHRIFGQTQCRFNKFSHTPNRHGLANRHPALQAPLPTSGLPVEWHLPEDKNSHAACPAAPATRLRRQSSQPPRRDDQRKPMAAAHQHLPRGQVSRVCRVLVADCRGAKRADETAEEDQDAHQRLHRRLSPHVAAVVRPS